MKQARRFVLTTPCLLALASACTDEAPDWVRVLESEQAALEPCDEVEPTVPLAPKRVAWWDETLGLTFEDVVASDFHACWSYEPTNNDGRATLMLAASHWSAEPGARTTVQIDAAEVLTAHANAQGGSGQLMFVLAQWDLMAISTDWSQYVGE